jgi:ABC-2 type transport system ATP-binding protein
MLQVKELSLKLKGKQILNGVDCDFETGVHGLLGPNGAGKTTFMRSILGLYPKTKGKVILDNQILTNQYVGYLPQKFGLFPNMTIRQALTYMGNLKNVPKQELENQIVKLVEEVGLNEKIDCKMSTLSGGMVRRVGIAQAFLGSPELIILDEPTAGLDPEERIRFKNYIKANKEGHIIILSTHIVNDVDYLCDYVEVMKAGNIIMKDERDMVAAKATGKVYGMSEGELEHLSEGYYVVSEYEENGSKKFRILTNSKADTDALTPTLEDGYLCVLREN